MANQYDHTTSSAELVAAFSTRIAGSTVLVTGVSAGGLGYQFLKEIMAADPSTLILAGRSAAKIQVTADEIAATKPSIELRILQIDLASFRSVREAAETVNSWADVPKIDVVVNNAGVMAPPYKATGDGIEIQFQANHLSHFLFTNLIMDKILASDSPRVVSIASNGARYGGIRWADVNFGNGERYDPFLSYAQSKTANILFAVSLSKRLGKHGLTAVSLHPGVVLGTELANGSYTTPDQFLKDMAANDDKYGTKFHSLQYPESEMKNEKNSVATHVFAAFSPAITTEEFNGGYFLDARIADPWKNETYAWARDEIDAERLWKLSEEMVGQEFNY